VDGFGHSTPRGGGVFFVDGFGYSTPRGKRLGIFKNYPGVRHNFAERIAMSTATTATIIYPDPEEYFSSETGDEESDMDFTEEAEAAQRRRIAEKKEAPDGESEAKPTEPVGDKNNDDEHSNKLIKAATVLMKEAMAVHTLNGTYHTVTILKFLGRAANTIRNRQRRDAETKYNKRLEDINQECARAISELTTEHSKGIINDEQLIDRIGGIQASRAVKEQAAAKELESSTHWEVPDYQHAIDSMRCPVSLQHDVDLISACKNDHVFSRKVIRELWRNSEGIPLCPMCRGRMKQVCPTTNWKVKRGKEYILAGVFPTDNAILPEHKAGKKKSRAGSEQ